jgi:SAM-dependent methyltransferase
VEALTDGPGGLAGSVPETRITEAAPAAPGGWGLRRSVRLLRAFRLEQTDPDVFYQTQAADSVAQVARYLSVDGKLVLDIGGGAGYFTRAFRAAGARCFLIEPEAGLGESPPSVPAPNLTVRERHRMAVRPARLAPRMAVAGDGNCLPFPDGVADLTFSSNVLEHVPDPRRFLDESVRVTRPGGLVYLSFTAWYSPWGGHETSPWHYVGGQRAARRYERRNRRPPGNLFGTSLFACHVGPTLRMVEARRDIEVVDAVPRYYPDWMRGIVRIPLVREVVTWNLLVILRRRLT